jgi:hypothetical protein
LNGPEPDGHKGVPRDLYLVADSHFANQAHPTIQSFSRNHNFSENRQDALDSAKSKIEGQGDANPDAVLPYPRNTMEALTNILPEDSTMQAKQLLSRRLWAKMSIQSAQPLVSLSIPLIMKGMWSLLGLLSTFSLKTYRYKLNICESVSQRSPRNLAEYKQGMWAARKRFGHIGGTTLRRLML